MLTNIICFFILVVLQSLAINGIYESFSKGNILYFIKQFLEKHISEYWLKPLCNCIKCMASFWGAITFFPLVLFVFGFHWIEIYIFIFDVFILVYLNFFIFKKL